MIGRALLAAAFLASSMTVGAYAQERTSKRDDYRSKKICKVEARKGSRLGGKRDCKTQAEWDELAREARLVAENIQKGPQPCLMGHNDPSSPGANVPVCN